MARASASSLSTTSTRICGSPASTAGPVARFSSMRAMIAGRKQCGEGPDSARNAEVGAEQLPALFRAPNSELRASVDTESGRRGKLERELRADPDVTIHGDPAAVGFDDAPCGRQP